jgi:hypothetical protein
MSTMRSLYIGLFALRTNLRSPLTRGGLVALAAIAALGPIGSWTSGQGLAVDGNLLFYGYLAGALFALRSGLEQQREGGLATYLRHNLATPVEHAAGMVLSLMGSWLVLSVVLFAVTLVYSGGDLPSAAWLATSFALALALLLPFTLMVESVMTFRIPLLLPVIGYLALVVILAMALGEERMAAILGFGVERGDPRSLLRLAVRAAVVLAVGMGLFLAAVAVRGRGARSATDVVSSGH